MKKIINRVGTFLAMVIMFLIALIPFAIGWTFRTWSNLTMEEMVFHVTAPLEGVNMELITDFLITCMVPALIIITAVCLVLYLDKNKKRYYIGIALGLLFVIAASSIYYGWNRLGIGEYLRAQTTESKFIEDNYVEPAEVNLTFPVEKRNLVFIFLESMETTYADDVNGGAFSKNVIPELTVLAQENEDFSESDNLNGGCEMPGTTWTMGAMFAHTSGLPLNINIGSNNMDTQESFFSGTVTLGDILKEAGYSQTLLIGSDATFGGRRLYFEEHGNYEMMDYKYALENSMIPVDYNVWWGYEDAKMFEFGKEKLLELAAKEEPFNLTMLTVDTHAENGYMCSECQNNFEDEYYSNVIACSSRQVAEFVGWIQQQEFYKDTTIVLVGDHLTMDSDYCEEVDQKEEYTRKIYTAYINPAVSKAINEERMYSSFDTFPTVLAAMGVQIEGERLGLGTNLFSEEKTILEKYGIEECDIRLKEKSKFMEERANLNMDSQELKMREGSAITAQITIEPQAEAEGVLVNISDIDNLTWEIESVSVAVWTDKDQSDLQWVQFDKDEEGNYWKEINLLDYENESGEFRLVAYVVANGSNMYILGDAAISLSE